MKVSTHKIIELFFEKNSSLKGNLSGFESSVELLSSVFRTGNKLLVCGNGGSASDAFHIVGELQKKFMLERKLSDIEKEKFALLPDSKLLQQGLKRGLSAISLVSEAGFCTAWNNDNSPELVFAQQTYVHGKPNDCLLAISTSGNSRNVFLACQVAKAQKMKTLALTGKNDSKIGTISDFCLRSSSSCTPHIQEDHIKLYHCLCYCLENEFFG